MYMRVPQCSLRDTCTEPKGIFRRWSWMLERVRHILRAYIHHRYLGGLKGQSARGDIWEEAHKEEMKGIWKGSRPLEWVKLYIKSKYQASEERFTRGVSAPSLGLYWALKRVKPFHGIDVNTNESTAPFLFMTFSTNQNPFLCSTKLTANQNTQS